MLFILQSRIQVRNFFIGRAEQRGSVDKFSTRDFGFLSTCKQIALCLDQQRTAERCLVFRFFIMTKLGLECLDTFPERRVLGGFSRRGLAYQLQDEVPDTCQRIGIIRDRGRNRRPRKSRWEKFVRHLE